MERKKLRKSTEDRMICGVCGGIAEYAGLDPTLVRLGLVLLGCSGIGVPAYLAAAVIMPEQE